MSRPVWLVAASIYSLLSSYDCNCLRGGPQYSVPNESVFIVTFHAPTWHKFLRPALIFFSIHERPHTSIWLSDPGVSDWHCAFLSHMEALFYTCPPAMEGVTSPPPPHPQVPTATEVSAHVTRVEGHRTHPHPPPPSFPWKGDAKWHVASQNPSVKPEEHKLTPQRGMSKLWVIGTKDAQIT